MPIEPSRDNADYIDSLYETYLANPQTVSPEWREYFQQQDNVSAISAVDIPQQVSIPAISTPDEILSSHSSKQVSVLQLINAYRFRGHRRADLDPLLQYERPDVAELNPAYHNLSEKDLDTVFNTGSLQGIHEAKLREIINIIQDTYCGTLGVEYMHINETAQKRWIQQYLETRRGNPNFSLEKKRQILNSVIGASALEEYLHSRYVGQKRFSLEGGESLIPLLDFLVNDAGTDGVKEMVIGMAHRGRINVLVNTLGKQPSDLFDEFEGRVARQTGTGDVKYHMGFSSDINTPGGPLHVTLGFNPSHLEIIDPVVEGSVRARQDRRNDIARDQVMPILIHGDAAFAGQGVVMETFNLSQTRGYATGGTIHIVINNQIGFTTSEPLDSRSTLYCTDVAKVIQAPILHVNGDDPEAVVYAGAMALAYRQEFNKDIVIDLICYRRHGHSEADEPLITQPMMYQKIKSHKNVRQLYSERLITEEVVTDEIVRSQYDHYIQALENNQYMSRPKAEIVDQTFKANYTNYVGTNWRDATPTSLSLARIQQITGHLTTLPTGFTPHRGVRKIIDGRRQMGAGEIPMDWGFAESLAYASLVEAGHPVRLSGQDSERGTFAHRHAVIHDMNTGEMFVPLQHITQTQAPFRIINSILSEEAVLGFEYGYSSSEPSSLVIWEAQFGDFANGAQVVIDQFISSSESKWGRYCGLTMFLPHGYDGQGPEHSSARLERYLQLCAEENMQVCIPSTPAQMFHMIRRQVLRPYRKPLIVMTPKSLLRHKLSVSNLDEITDGKFETVLSEIDPLKPEVVTRVLFCSGKVYFDLLEARRANGIDNIAILRIEQLYPFPKAEVEAQLALYKNAIDIIWVQEEPVNQGSWFYILGHSHLTGCLQDQHVMGKVARPFSASPAVGYLGKHREQQEAIITDALKLEK
jgi:2-oxoglutarate dehydrogenase E1 component